MTMKKIFSILAVASAMAMSSCSSNSASDSAKIEGEWLIEKAMGVSTSDGESEAFINFDDKGNLNGCTSVNVFTGEYKREGKSLSLQNIGMTKMMGPHMEIEDAVTNAINACAGIEIDGVKARILDKESNTIMELSKK